MIAPDWIEQAKSLVFLLGAAVSLIQQVSRLFKKPRKQN